MLGTKLTHAKGRVTFNINELRTCYRKEEHLIYDRSKIIQITWLETINYEGPLVLHDVAKSPMPSNTTY